MPPVRPGELFNEAFRAVWRTASAVALYLVIIAVGSLAFTAARSVLLNADDDPSPSVAATLLAMLLDVLMATAGAIAACLAFSRMGRELDKPLWKVEGDLEALRRFFLPWFILGLGVTTVYRVLMTAAAQTEDPFMALFGLMTYVFLAAFVIPIGACIMFLGQFSWSTMGESLAPLSRQFVYVVGFLLFGFLVYMMLFMLAIGFPHRPGLDAPEAWLATGVFLLLDLLGALSECVVFAGIWLICRMDRDTVQDSSDDFDF